MDLEAQKTLMNGKIKNLQSKVTELTRRNEELEKVNRQQIIIKSEGDYAC